MCACGQLFVACGIMLVCMWLYFILFEMHMYVYVYVFGCLNILVFVFVYVYVRVSGHLFACAYRRITVTQSKCCPPARRFGLAFLGPLRPARPRLSCDGSTEPVACAACQTGKHGHAQRRLRPPPCCGWCMFCFCGVLLCWCACR